MSKQIIKGDAIQLFLNGSAPLYATSHTLTLTGNTVDIATKDHGSWGASEIGNLTWELTAECLYSDGDYDDMFDRMVAKTKLMVQFAKVANYDPNGLVSTGGSVQAWTPDVQSAKKGYAVVTSLTANANTGENATYSITFTGAGPLTPVLPINDYLEMTMDFDTTRIVLFEVSRTDADIKIYNANTGAEIPTSNDEGVISYTGRDNLNDVPVRIKMDGSFIIDMNAHLGGDNITINMSTVPSFLWFNTEKTGIKDIVFGEKVKTISAGAFDNRPNSGSPNSALRYKSLPIVPPTMGQNGLGNIAEVISITVPEGTLDAYKTAWSGYTSANWIEE